MAKKVATTWEGTATKIQSCRVCHGKRGPQQGSPAEGTKAPSYEDANKKLCVACHKRLGGGPQTWESFFVIEPVSKEEAQP